MYHKRQMLFMEGWTITVSQIEFDPDTLSVSWRGRIVKLLPKEYTLLDFMYRHPNQTFTRSQLLDQVWPLEAPVDRTVDDHIYRLRRHLASWDSHLKLETVRGSGYRLSIKRTSTRSNPLQSVKPYIDEMRGVTNTLIRYGHGEALLLLVRHQETLGIELDPGVRLMLQFTEGGASVLFDADIPFRERLFMLLYLNQLANPSDNQRYVEKTVQYQLMPAPWQNELESLILIPMLMDWGAFEQAKRKLDGLVLEVESRGLDELVPFVCNLKLEYALHVQRWDTLEQDFAAAEELMKKYAYQREEGKFLVLKGILRSRSSRRLGLACIEDGLTLLKESMFLPHLINGLYTVIRFSMREGLDLHPEYMKQVERLWKSIGLDETGKRLEHELHTHLENL